jgi:hypothetical protein
MMYLKIKAEFPPSRLIFSPQIIDQVACCLTFDVLAFAFEFLD